MRYRSFSYVHINVFYCFDTVHGHIILPEHDLKRKGIRTAQINKCWYDSLYFVLLSIILIVVLTASFGKYFKTHNGLHKFMIPLPKILHTVEPHYNGLIGANGCPF
jgi:hypothetical protein